MATSSQDPTNGQAPLPANATIYLIRHAEKPDHGKGLSPAGEARAEAYVAFFQNLSNPSGQTIQWNYLFASTDSTHSDRPVLTITPLADALKKTIDSTYPDADYQGLVDHLRKHAADRYADANILICWHHGEILQLATALGASPHTLPAASNWPASWPGTEFGWLLEIHCQTDGSVDAATTQAVNEHLMPDDTRDPVYGK